MKRKRIGIPISSVPICGHNGVFSMRGHEERFFVYHGKNADYVGSYESFGCSRCEKTAEEEMTERAKEMEERGEGREI